MKTLICGLKTSLSVKLWLLILCFVPFMGIAQIDERVYMTDSRLDSTKKGELSIEIDNISFFQNNEFSSDLVKGYTLPGMWVQPKAVFYPLGNIKLEAGLHMLRYWGANKYPNFAYTDIAKWKGSQYQSGVHWLPYFRAHFSLSPKLDIILGNIYGAANHRLADPLYNSELNLSADPEAGMQLLYKSKVVDVDAWINWESFIFEGDTHQEAFTVGLSSQLRLNETSKKVHFYLPVQVLAQHRGGEIDTIFTNSIQTNINAAVGAGITVSVGDHSLRQLNFELTGVGLYQQSGKWLPYTSGYGIYPKLTASFKYVRLKAAYWTCHNFVSLLGSPFFGSLSTAYPGRQYQNPGFIYAGFEYSKTFAKGFSLGVDLDVYRHNAVTSLDPEKGLLNEKAAVSFGAGVYLRINPTFLLKKF
ncbi:MAG TPA: hypothetical protein PKA78_04035 [Macellibacteroides fermentans]|uniref:hypothetical protein n=1 Tax=Macellibacteroides fermentans TaxID=879969 RepID=UPI002CAA5F80|nr:hypothetical protein [Macellibacteroides fermentans]